MNTMRTDKPTRSSPIRIGRINFTNAWPIFHQFPADRFDGDVEIVSRVPTELNRALESGEIDMSAISSFAYGRSFQDYVLFPDLSVSANGRVNSILLFHREPLEKIANGHFMLPTTSATSINLLKICMEKFLRGEPEYTYAPPVLEAMMENADAALLIGDDAIRAQWTNRSYLVTDLGELWREYTGHSMTFAVWAVRKEAAVRRPELVSRVFDAFVESKRNNLSDLDGVIGEAISKVGGEPSFWRGYFTQLTYEFGPGQWAGLELYFRYAWELRLLDEPVPLQIWNPQSAQVKE